MAMLFQGTSQLLRPPPIDRMRGIRDSRRPLLRTGNGNDDGENMPAPIFMDADASHFCKRLEES
jgi:hypothetical protein